MIKLKELLDEAIYVQSPSGEEGDDALMKQGFKLGKATIDPETGASITDVEYLPEFENIRRKVLTMRKEFQPFKYAADENISKVAKDINTNLTKVSQLIFALDKMIELQNKRK
jgi:hypothetical protein